MQGLWLRELESLEAISQDGATRRIFLRLAALTRERRLDPFLDELAADVELDASTKGTLSELARDESFLLAVEEYLRRTTVLH